MSHITIISSSPRKNGNSDVLAQEFARGARKAGHTVDKIDVREIDLKFCIGCLVCQRTGKCVLRDDIDAILPRVQNADALVFATPIYYYGMSGQLKTFLDRMNPLFGQKNRFKRVYLLTAAADGDESAADGAITGLQGWIDCFDGVTLAGVVRGTGVADVGEIASTDAPKKAYRLGKSVQ